MNYEIVYVEEKTVVGLRIRTSNSDPYMSRSIGELWQRFYQEGIYDSIPGKHNDKSIGLYTDYQMGDNDAYDVIVCCEVEGSVEAEVKEEVKAETDAGTEVGRGAGADAELELEEKTIPAGKYAKFIVRGHVQQAVAEFWTKLWSMELDRKFSSDFEEYQSGGNMDNAEIHIYIALN
ncbi:GyrI-like domain-containing protein [Paenibacillus bouchesdurhonensis]|uniref:GyrI-like domain-containing protein n=1 Tax=Paenibacillus bouchesdurhonensis TaxID=1870990 RepID=UPI000DA62A9A|nr:GyrI-like domain-containing protein [Paenibacillus bouchesdurhonensis]